MTSHIENPSINERGDQTHPAFGSIRVDRITSTPGVALFDSQIPHTRMVRVSIGHMTRKRDLNQDWLHSTGPSIVEVDMSEAQWAAFVSSAGSGDVPCTLSRTETDGRIPGLPLESRLADSAAETRNAATKAFAKITEAMNAVDALDPKCGAKARREAMATLRAAIANAPSNVEFASDSLTEHAENVTQQARADIEAMARQAAVEAHRDNRTMIEGEQS